MSVTELAAENTLLRHALKRIAEQLELEAFDISEDNWQTTPEQLLSRIPHLRQFAADIAKDVNSRPGFKQYIYEILSA